MKFRYSSLFLRIALIFLAPNLWAPNLWAVELESMRFAVEDTTTRLIMDLTGPVHHELFDLKNPDRVVLDLMDTRSTLAAMPKGQGFVQQLRTGKPQEKTLRVVLDLNKAVRMRSYQITPEEGDKHRLVVELYSNSTPVTVKSADQIVHSRDIIVAIDPGHGGVDPGAIGKTGTQEKDVVLAIATRLKQQLDKENGFRGVLIRSDDRFLLHRDRMLVARSHGADLFISIHADAFRDSRAHGSTVYVLSERGASSEAARWLAERENAADLRGGVSLGDKDDVLAQVLLDLSQTASLSASIEVGSHVTRQLGKVGRVRKKEVQHAGFLVLKSPDIPSILVETAFISNPSEEKKLRSDSHQQAWAKSIATGIVQYFYENPPSGSLVARQQHMERPRDLTYTIARGDTLSAIADRFNVRLRYLRQFNQIRGDRIRVGQVIRIPRSTSS